MRTVKTLPLCMGLPLTLALVFILFVEPPEKYQFANDFDVSQLWYLHQAEPIKQTKLSQNHAEYIINPVHLCEQVPTNEPIDYLVIIFSRPMHAHRRNAVRETWASELRCLTSSRVVFLLAKTDDANLQKTIEAEAHLYSAIIQGTHVDNSKNQTLKGMIMLQWALKHCFRTDFLLKADDDTYLNVPVFLNTMTNKRRNAIHGFAYKNQGPQRNPESKWFVYKKEFKEISYPDFTAGAFYVIGWTVVDLIYEASKMATFVWLEDVLFTGFSASEAGVDVVHDDVFSVHRPTSIWHVRKKASSRHISADDLGIY
ncbi:unnamed protein product, partial [Ixodes pacificus]